MTGKHLATILPTLQIEERYLLAYVAWSPDWRTLASVGGYNTSSELLLSVDAAHQVLPALLKALKKTDEVFQSPSTRIKGESRAKNIVHALLYFSLQGKPLPKNAIPFLLTTTQHTVLRAILRSEAAWYRIDRTVEIFDAFGLPYRWQLQELLCFL